jgi:sporulation protein YlmC with PRC-barrel domain
MNASTTTSDVIRSDRVEGTSVYNETGDKLGSIDNLIIDKRTGQVRHAVLEFGGFLGLGTDRYPIPWSMLKYDTDRDGYVVPIDKSRLDDAPRYPYADESPFVKDTSYGQRVNKFYGY